MRAMDTNDESHRQHNCQVTDFSLVHRVDTTKGQLTVDSR